MLFLMGCTDAVGDSGPWQGAFNVLSYNVHGLPPEITGDDMGARMEKISPLLQAFDLVGIQEDWTNEGHTKLEADNDFPLRHWFSEKSGTDRVYGSGLDTYSRLSESEYYTEYYTDCYGLLEGASDCWASKGFQVVRIPLGPGAEIDWYNSHLEAGSGPEDDAARHEGVSQLIAAMNGYSAGRAILFTGDTNLSKSDLEDAPELDRWLGEAGLQSACDLLGCAEPDRIDLVLLRDGQGTLLTAVNWEVRGEFVDDAGVPLSDHEPIAVQIAWARD